MAESNSVNCKLLDHFFDMVTTESIKFLDAKSALTEEKNSLVEKLALAKEFAEKALVSHLFSVI